MTKPKSSRSIFARKKTDDSSRSAQTRKNTTIPSSIFVKKPLYEKRPAGSEAQSKTTINSPTPKQDSLSETERDTLMRTFLRDRKYWGITSSDPAFKNETLDENLERAKGGLFKNMTDETLREYVDTGKRRKALARYVFIEGLIEDGSGEDYHEERLREIDRLNETKFKRYSTEKLITYVDRLNDDFVSGKRDKRDNKSPKKAANLGLWRRLKTALKKTPDVPKAAPSTDQPLQRSVK